MIRAVVATAVVVTWVGTADAGSGRKIAVESEPAGASVYLNDKESGPACPGTPCTIEAPPGEITVIIELEKHQSKFEALVVPKRGRVPKIAVKMVPAVGTIVVDGPAGATVMVDDVDQGKAPVRIDTTEEPHHVVVTLNGKTIYDDFVEVTTGAETEVTPKQVALGGGGDGGGGDGDGGGGDGNGGGVTKSTTPKKKRDRFILASAAVDIGFRQFSYSGVDSGSMQKLRTEKEGGQVLAGPLIELWPGELAGVDPLRGLSLLARLQFGVNSQDVTGNGIMNPTNTFWQSMEFSVRYRRTIAKMFTAEGGIGYVRDQFQFEGMSADVALLPDVDYKSVRLGLRASVILDFIEPYLALENRVVTSGGKLAERFPKADASGFRFTMGVNARRGAMLARVEGSLTSYTWDITAEPTGDMRATGASDSIQQIQFAIGYQY